MLLPAVSAPESRRRLAAWQREGSHASALLRKSCRLAKPTQRRNPTDGSHPGNRDQLVSWRRDSCDYCGDVSHAQTTSSVAPPSAARPEVPCARRAWACLPPPPVRSQGQCWSLRGWRSIAELFNSAMLVCRLARAGLPGRSLPVSEPLPCALPRDRAAGGRMPAGAGRPAMRFGGSQSPTHARRGRTRWLLEGLHEHCRVEQLCNPRLPPRSRRREPHHRAGAARDL